MKLRPSGKAPAIGTSNNGPGPSWSIVTAPPVAKKTITINAITQFTAVALLIHCSALAALKEMAKTLGCLNRIAVAAQNPFGHNQRIPRVLIKKVVGLRVQCLANRVPDYLINSYHRSTVLVPVSLLGPSKTQQENSLAADCFE